MTIDPQEEISQDGGDENKKNSLVEILVYVTILVIVALMCLGGLKMLELIMKWFMQLFILKES